MLGTTVLRRRRCSRASCRRSRQARDRRCVVDVASDPRVARPEAAGGRATRPARSRRTSSPSAIKDIVDSYRATNPGLGTSSSPAATTRSRSSATRTGLLGQESGYVPPVRATRLRGEPAPQLRAQPGRLRRRDAISSHERVPGAGPRRRPARRDAGRDRGRARRLHCSHGGVVAPTRSLVTGYDFLADAADAVQDELEAGTGAARRRARSRPADNVAAGSGVLDRDQLRRSCSAARHDLIFLAGHFSANSALAADFTTSLLTTELAASR